MTGFRLATLVASVVAVVLFLAACGGSDSDGDKAAVKDCTPKWEVETKEKGVLTVAAVQYPPYSEIRPGSDQVGGIDGAVITRFAEQACLKVKGVATTFAAAVSSITSRRADVALGSIYRTAERAKEVGLSDPVYLDQLGIISREGIDSIRAMEGRKVATMQGYYFQDDVQKVFGKDLKLFPSNVNMFQDLIAGRSEAGLDSYAAAVAYFRSRGINDFKVIVPPPDPRVPATGAHAAQTTVLYSKDAPKLGKAFNEFLATEREAGTLGDLLEAQGLPRSAADVGDPRLL